MSYKKVKKSPEFYLESDDFPIWSWHNKGQWLILVHRLCHVTKMGK